ncbi:DUF4190 domain-containing protein [Paraoerskovia marina]|uniref:DUF4190 domain-containing protein n=1 Tax=Paraoerskovia marina TaxID=545619 RepID=UPI0005B7EFF8|nr:DUF4190 domain-containing protein [Paraoerskovia marina]
MDDRSRPAEPTDTPRQYELGEVVNGHVLTEGGWQPVEPSAEPADKGGSGLAVASLVLGIIAVVLCLVPIVNNLAMVLALVGLPLGVVALVGAIRKGRGGRGMAIAGIVLAITAGIGVLASQSAYGEAIDEITSDVEETAPSTGDDEGQETAPDDSTDGSTEDAPADDTSGESDNASFGSTYTYDDGLAVTISEPESFTPGEWAFGGEDAPAHVKFTITVDNGTDEPFDPSLFTTSLASGGAESDSVYDDDISGSPDTKVMPGKSVSFVVGYGVEDPDDLTMEVSPDFLEHEEILVAS